MEYDAFIGGIEPGGLRNKNEIRILLCYLVNSIGAPLSREDVLSIMQENGFANYFEVTDALHRAACLRLCRSTGARPL